MKLNDRQRVEGTKVTIGHRVCGQGEHEHVGRQYVAEYRNLDGVQVCRSLGTPNKARARRLAVEIQQRLESGVAPIAKETAKIEEVLEAYLEAVTSRSLAPKTEWKYKADLEKLKEYCRQTSLTLASRFTEEELYRYRRWLVEKDYADKTVQGAVVLAKQAFKWAWRRGTLRDYHLARATFPKAKAQPQPCFTTDQVEQLLGKAEGEEKLAIALMAYAGLRIGEVEQLRWEDIRRRDGQAEMIHVRRGGSGGSTKDKDERFVPVHPRIASLLPSTARSGAVFSSITERCLLKRLKELCTARGWENPRQYKLHSFRHHFASLCANHQVAYRKTLAWLGHSSSQMLDLYYHLHDEDSRQAMLALAHTAEKPATTGSGSARPEDILRTMDQSTIEKTLQAPEVQELVACLAEETERPGFEPGIRI